MSRLDERKALETLRSTSPTQSLIELASQTIQSCNHNCKHQGKTAVDGPEKILDDDNSKDSVSIKSRGS